ncbi:hypothetical protein JFV29_22825 [Peribacillus sp. TH16]|uniref:hypothetical protein n=1 Tax=Peribacillus sp. TH16 TaxID=2798482 RepID=UPI0019114192|nr:hypothetical protein [Peribacillus sp. TH16]MBK5484680.1 hypothetical protein [Peribacillus sp. TH16]
MSHDLYASWANSELADIFTQSPIHFLNNSQGRTFSIYATKEGKTNWPLADGVLVIEENGSELYRLALEFKKKNEGIHGILTALGQSQAYLDKGYHGTVIIIPDRYDTHSQPGQYLKQILDMVSNHIPISIVTYHDPDLFATSPFRGKLNLIRAMDLSNASIIPRANASAPNYIKTQWAHLREGSSDSDAFYRYLQIAKRFSIDNLTEPVINIPMGLSNAVQKLGGTNLFKYLSNSVGDTLHDIVWRNFWLSYVLNDDTIEIWSKNGNQYVVNENSSKLLTSDDQFKKFFVGRSDSIKNKLVSKLNNSNITEDNAWEEFATNVRNRAHSYREDLDSGMTHIGLLDNDGKPTDIGYRFVDACERNRNNSNGGTPRAILGSAILKIGQLGAFLYYAHRLSDEKFENNVLEFTARDARGRLKFNQKDYLIWLEDELSNNLKVMRKVSLRGGAARQPFQAELAILRQFGFIKKGFRIGVGLNINWEVVQNTMDVKI